MSTDYRFVTIYRIPNPAPRAPLFSVVTADGRELDGLVGIGMAGGVEPYSGEEFAAVLNFEGGRDEQVRARFAVLLADEAEDIRRG